MPEISPSFSVSSRLYAALGAVVVAAGFIAVASSLLVGSGAAKLLLDLQPNGESSIEEYLTYPITIQNIMWVMFFLGCGELLVRYLQGAGETGQLSKKLLPEDDSTMLRARDLGGIYNRVKESAQRPYFLQRLVLRTIAQFQSSRSINQANSLMNSTLELYQHEIELRYNIIRYLVWVIPTLGFIGTVMGIALALAGAAHPDLDLQDVAQVKKIIDKLGVAFFTTLLALLQSMVLVFIMHIVQGREESALNDVGQYCLDNLINRLYEK